MYAYIDRKKKLPVTTLLRAIGYEADQQILEIFDLADEVKVTKANLKKAVGRKLAARVLSTWVEDFVDEDTGEVVSIERNNVIVDRETVLQEEHVEQILESGAKTILLHKENLSGIDFSIIYNTLQKDPCNSEKEAVVYIYRQLRASEPPDEATARDVIEKLFFSDKRYDLGDVGRYRINKKLGGGNAFWDAMNYENVGGTPVLGVNAPVVIGHGISSPKAIRSMILSAERCITADLTAKLQRAFKN